MIFCIYTRRLCDWQNHSGVWQIFAWISPQNAVIKLTSNIIYEYRHIQNARFCYAICHSLNKCELCASNISPFRYSTNVTTHIEWYGNANRTLHATCPVITPIKLNASKPALLYSILAQCCHLSTKCGSIQWRLKNPPTNSTGVIAYVAAAPL